MASIGYLLPLGTTRIAAQSSAGALVKGSPLKGQDCCRRRLSTASPGVEHRPDAGALLTANLRKEALEALLRRDFGHVSREVGDSYTFSMSELRFAKASREFVRQRNSGDRVERSRSFDDASQSRAKQICLFLGRRSGQPRLTGQSLEESVKEILRPAETLRGVASLLTGRRGRHRCGRGHTWKASDSARGGR